MTHRKTFLFAPLLLLAACGPDSTPLAPSEAPALEARSAPPGRGGALGTVYVTSQGLYYDTFVSAETLPPHGRFQKLEAGMTEFGPGQPGYLGGRWWIDDGDGVMEDNGDDTYLLCPLLGPGRTEP